MDYSQVVDGIDVEIGGDIIIPQVESASDYNCPMGKFLWFFFNILLYSKG